MMTKWIFIACKRLHLETEHGIYVDDIYLLLHIWKFFTLEKGMFKWNKVQGHWIL